MSFKKAEVMLRDLKEKLKMRLPATYVMSEASDVNGYSVLSIQQDSVWATTEQKVVIRIKREDILGTNAVDGPAIAYSPHICQIAVEESAVAGVSVLSDVNEMKLMFEIAKMGCAVELYFETAGAEPVVGTFVPAKLKLKLDDLRFPLTGV